MHNTIFSVDVDQVRRRTITLTFMLILLISIVSFALLSYNFSTLLSNKIDEHREMAVLLFNKFMQEHFDVHETIIYANLNTKDVREGIVSGDRKRLFKALNSRYKVLSEGYPHLNVLHIVTPQNRSFLRMHQPGISGDDLSRVRPMHVRANANLELLHGMEVGKYGISLRSVAPIIYDGIHYGTLEVGTPLLEIVSELQKMLNIEILLYLDKNDLEVSKLKHLESYDAKHSILFGSPLFREMKPDLQERSMLTYHNKRYMLYRGNPLFNFSGEPIGEFYFAIDITDEKAEEERFELLHLILTLGILGITYLILHVNLSKMTRELHHAESYSRLILDAQQNMVILSSGMELLDANLTFLKFFNYESVALFKQDHKCVCDFFNPQNSDDFISGPLHHGMNWSAYILQHPEEALKVQITREGLQYFFAVAGTSTQIGDDSVAVLTFTDITPMATENKTLHRLSRIDTLTQINNRHAFNATFEELFNRSHEEQSALSILFFDIDFFKNVNDTYGHDTGDEVLKALARLVADNIRTNDILARWGGEEFMVILPNATLISAKIIAEKLRHIIATHAFETIGTLTCSFGVADNQSTIDAATMLKHADEALYKAKQSGRNCVATAF